MKKKLLGVLSALCMMTSVAMGTQVSAETPAIYDMGTWTGSGVLSNSIENYNYKAVNAIKDDNGVIDASAYTADITDTSITISFTEAYLSTLADGEYRYYAEFAVNDWVPAHINCPLVLDEQNTGTVLLEDEQRIAALYNNDTVVDPSNYTVNVDTVTVNADYLETLTDEPAFYCTLDRYADASVVYLKMTVANGQVQDVTDAATETTVATETVSAAPQGSPKTGSHGIAPVVALMTAAGVAVVITKKKVK
ncbi:MAG: hypothetical protein IJA12_04855 [Oscillospiraceae bacterium]|nr:hypothetical protein [Oscillospiraceae bacterium]